MDAEPPPSMHNSRRGSMLRRTFSFTDLYSKSSPTDSDQPSRAPTPDGDSEAAPALPRAGNSSSGPFAMIRSTIYSKEPRTVRKDPRSTHEKRFAARFVVRCDFQEVIWRIVNAKRRNSQTKDAAERLGAVQRAAAAAAEEATVADRLLFTPPTPHRPFNARELPWFASRIAADKRKHNDDDDEVDDETRTKRLRVQEYAPPMVDDAATTSEPSSSSSTVVAENAFHTSTATTTDPAPSPTTEIAITSPIAITIATPPATVIAASPITPPRPVAPITTVPTPTMAATTTTETTIPATADNTRVPIQTATHTGTTAIARRHSNASLADQASSSSSQTSAVASNRSANTRVRRRASEPILVIYRDSDETEPVEPPAQDARKAKKARRGSLKAKENRGQRRNSANDPIQN